MARDAERDPEAERAEEAVRRAEASPHDDGEADEEDEIGEELEVQRGHAHRGRVPNRPVDVSAWAGDELAHACKGRSSAVPDPAERARPGESARPGRVELCVQERERRAALLPQHERVHEDQQDRAASHIWYILRWGNRCQPANPRTGGWGVFGPVIWAVVVAHSMSGEPERFVCYGGYKSFYLDWNYDLWRCDAWDQRLCSVWQFLETPRVRDGCTACMADCYRDSSVMLHFAGSLGDAIDRLGEGRVLAALKALADGRNLDSINAVVRNAPVLWRLAKLG